MKIKEIKKELAEIMTVVNTHLTTYGTTEFVSPFVFTQGKKEFSVEHEQVPGSLVVTLNGYYGVSPRFAVPMEVIGKMQPVEYAKAFVEENPHLVDHARRQLKKMGC